MITHSHNWNLAWVLTRFLNWPIGTRVPSFKYTAIYSKCQVENNLKAECCCYQRCNNALYLFIRLQIIIISTKREIHKCVTVQTNLIKTQLRTHCSANHGCCQFTFLCVAIYCFFVFIFKFCVWTAQLMISLGLGTTKNTWLGLGK